MISGVTPARSRCMFVIREMVRGGTRGMASRVTSSVDPNYGCSNRQNIRKQVVTSSPNS